MKSVISGKLADGELIVLDKFAFEKASTKQAAAIIKALELQNKRVTLVVDDDDVETYLSFRNLPKVVIYASSEVNTRILVDNAALVMTVDVAKQLEEALS